MDAKRDLISRLQPLIMGVPHLCGYELQCSFSQAFSEMSSSAISQQLLIIPHLL